LEVAMNLRVSAILSGAFGMLLAGCSSTPPPPVLASVVVVEHGSDAGGDFCRDFRLSREQVASYFHRAQEIDERTQHDRYDYLPCYVHGTATIGGQVVQWTIRAGGTAIVSSALPNKTRYFGCDSCDDLFTPNHSR
jgi:hypothetical protein